MSKPKAVKPKEHYVDNKVLAQAVVEYADLVKEAKSKDEEIPTPSEYLGECILRISKGIASKSNFSGYSYKDDMIMDGVQDCLRALKNFKIDAETRSGNPNAFGYFTMIIHRAMIRRIQKEQKQTDIKERIMSNQTFDQYATGGENFTGGESILQRTRSRNDMLRKRDENEAESTFKVVKRARRSNDSNLDDYL